MEKTETDWSQPQRQGGPALLIIIFKTFIGLLKNIWPLVIAILFTGKNGGSNKMEWFLLLFSGLVLIRSLIEFYFFKFRIIKNELIIRKGFITKRTIVLPLEKIIAVHMEQSWLHRLFNASQVSFDSAGSTKTEVVIKAIRFNKAKMLQQYITEARPLTGKATLELDRPQIKPLITLSASDLFKLSVSANHVEAFFLLLVFSLTVIGNISEATGQQASGVLSWLYQKTDTGTITGVLFLAAFFLLVSMVVSAIRVLLIYANFRIVRSERGFSIRSGLINTKEKLVPFSKIQYLSWKANWLRKKMGIFLLHFHAAGTAERHHKMQVIMPATQKKFITEILKDYHQLLPVTILKPLSVDKAYIARNILLKGILPAGVLCFISWFAISWYAAFFLLLIPYVALSSWLFRKKFNMWSVPEAIQINKGIFGSEVSIMIWGKIQCIHFKQSIFQRRKKLATLKLFTAGGAVTIPFIKQEEAVKIYNYALFKIESENKKWL